MVGFFDAHVLQPSQALRITEHKYKSSGSSAFEFLLRPFWNWCAPSVPQNISPNVLTVGGLLFNVVPIVIILFYSPTLREQIPSIVILFLGIGAFIYQTLDALDGLHARRTNTSSPLGELLDHGCDAISMYLLSIGYLAILSMGHNPAASFIQFFCLNCVFYTSQWQAYVTGTMTFSSFSVTEAIIFLVLFSFITAYVKFDFWLIRDPIFGLPLNLIQFIVVFVGSMVLFSQVLHVISRGGVGKYGTTVANTSVLFPICPLLLVIGSAALVACWSSSGVYQQHTALFLMCFGAVMAKVSQNLVIAHMTKSSLSLSDSVMFGPSLLLVNAYFDCPLNEHFLLWIACLWSTFDMLYFCFRVCNQIANVLDIPILRMPKQRSSMPRKRAGVTQTPHRTRTPSPEADDAQPNISTASLRSRTRR